MPRTVLPMLCTLVEEAPAGAEWAFETKWDGERCIVFFERGRGKPSVRLQSRLIKDQTRRYPELAADFARLKVRNAVIDGEIVALDEKGRASFEALQRRFGLTDEVEIAARVKDTPTSFAAFDLLWLDGRDLRVRPLAERRKLLRTLIRPCRRAAYSQDYEDAVPLMRAVKRVGIEGIVAKRRDSPYKEGARGRDWLKIKVTESQEFVIGGWTEGTGRRSGSFGALVVGVYEGKKLVSVGSVGTGFDDRSLGDMFRKLRRLETRRCPFDPVPDVRNAHWVRPKLVAQVKFANWTSSGSLRVPVFLGLRSDKRPEDCVREKPKRK